MIVVAIIGILAGIGIPQYANYTKRAKFSDVVSQVVPYKVSVGMCIQYTNKIEGCSSGTQHVGPAVSSNGYVTSLTVNNGTITATGTQEVDSAVYKLIPDYSASTNTLTWSLDTNIANDCFDMGLCKKTN